MKHEEVRYDITDLQDQLNLRDKVTEIAESMCCENQNCKLEKVMNISSSKEESFAYYSVSAVVLDVKTGHLTDFELIQFDENGSTIKDFYDLHPEVERPDEAAITEEEMRQYEKATAPSWNIDLETEHNSDYNTNDICDSFEEPF